MPSVDRYPGYVDTDRYPGYYSIQSTATCGTGIWEGCTAGIQNKYLIIGGGVLAVLLLSMRG